MIYYNGQNLENWVVDLPLPIDEEKYSSKMIQTDINVIFNILLDHSLINKVKGNNSRSNQLRAILKELSGEYISRSDIAIYLLNHGFKIKKDKSDKNCKMNIKSFNLSIVQELFEATHRDFKFMSKNNKMRFDLAKLQIDKYLESRR